VLGSITRARAAQWSTYMPQLFRLLDSVQLVLARAVQNPNLPKKETVLLACCRTLSLLLQLIRERSLTAQTLKLYTTSFRSRPFVQSLLRACAPATPLNLGKADPLI